MPLITKLRRVGRFQIHIQIIQQGDKEQLRALFGKLIITRAEMILHTGCIDYVAICDEFEPLSDGDHVPFYQFDLNNGKWTPKKIEEQFNRLDKK